MCGTCGCVVNGDIGIDKIQARPRPSGALTTTIIPVQTSLLEENNHQAAHNRSHFNENNVLVINLMSSPGAGKTSLLEATIEALRAEFRIAVIEGDLETENDAERIRAKGVPAVQITTGQACHLDAYMIHEALHHIELSKLDILFIENVGNLVCPASFDLGQHKNVVILSVPEGDDKPLKYPVMFRAADLLLISKIDFLPILDDFSCSAIVSHMRQLGRPDAVLEISAKERVGLEAWLNWLRAEVPPTKARTFACELTDFRNQRGPGKEKNSIHAHDSSIKRGSAGGEPSGGGNIERKTPA